MCPEHRAAKRLAASFAALLAALLALLVTRPALAANDPDLEWWTLETKHFRIHYAKELEFLAERVARLSEDIHRRLVGPLGYAPDERTEVAITDFTDSANGSATPVPYNAVRLFVTAPGDLSPLNDYDDWYLGLMTHEYAHILHTDNISGVPALLNAILGKTLSPHQAQPRWITEGLAVVAESAFTSGGRIRSTIFDAYLRADVLDDNVARLDQFSNSAQRWPQGNLWYLYGSRFLQWISEVYGRDVLRAVAADYGSSLIPYGINRAIRRQTGRTYVELYQGFEEHLRRSYGKQMKEVARRGLREGQRLTHHGGHAYYPAFVPPGARYEPSDGGLQIAYYRDDQNHRAGVYLLRLPAAEGGEVEAELLARSRGGDGPIDFTPSGDLVFSSVVPHEVIYRRNDLFRVERGKRAPNGSERWRHRLTFGLRAIAPTVSPDGRAMAFTVNDAGTTTLKIADVHPQGKLERIRTLVPPEQPLDQAFTPRFSPDGARIAYSEWRRGGFRDVVLVDVATGERQAVTNDRSLDINPTWSPDGERLYFASDRTGIFNIYEYTLATGKLRQVTNVRTMAVMPAVSPDGELLAYVGYGSKGYDLFVMRLDPARYLEALPPPDDRPAPHPEPPAVPMTKERYNPLSTLLPRAWGFDYGPGNFGGNALRVTTVGQDMAGHHAFAASVIADPAAPLPQMALEYTYGRLPVDLGLRIANAVTPRDDARIGGYKPSYVERSFDVRTSAAFRIPGEFVNQSLGVSYTASIIDAELPVASVPLDPLAKPTKLPERGYLGTVRLGYSISDTEGGLRAPGTARGYALSIGLDVADEITGSSESLYAVNYSAVGYLPMPWPGHHVLALRTAGAISKGSYARRGRYFVGGHDTENVDLLTTLLEGPPSGAFVLRGYPAQSYGGSTFLLQTLEYRFPIAVPDIGPSTLPLYLRRIDGALFLDYGGAFNDFDFRGVDFFTNGAIIDSDQLHTGVGGELWIAAGLAYFVELSLKLGYAFGFSAEAVPGGQLYFLAAGSF